MGTGEPGTGIEIWAERKTTRAPSTIRATCRSRLPIRSPIRIGTRKSAIVIPR